MGDTYPAWLINPDEVSVDCGNRTTRGRVVIGIEQNL